MRHIITSSFIVLVSTAVGCSGPGDTVLEVVHNPCEPLVIAPARDASATEVASIDDAIVMWNQRVGSRLTREPLEDAPRVPVRFEEAALAFFGLYEDETGDVVINRKLEDRHERAVTIAHELGHAFGMFHVNESTRSIMNKGNLRLEPQPFDVHKLEASWGSCLAAD